jgi:hypothetical protein
MKAWCVCLAALLLNAGIAHADVILRLPTSERVVALTFDGCEQQRPMKLDTGISDFLVANRIVRETLEAVRPGDILIHHINGRGWHTAEALPRLIAGLKADGYRFVLLKDYLAEERSRAPQPR